MKQRGVCAHVAGYLMLAPIVVLLARPGATQQSESNPSPTKSWMKATPASVGVDEGVLDAFNKELASGKYGLVDSFTVFRCGKEVYAEKYAHDYGRIYGKEAKEKGPLNARLTGPYNYFDPAWHPYYKGTDLHSMQSVSKTVTSVIIGIAMTRGDFKAGVDTPVLKYFDVAKVKNVDDRKRRMTLKDVLTMTTGLKWNEDVPYDDPRSDSSLMEATDDWVQYVIDKPMAAEPGKVFDYSSGATELLAYIFQKETGQDLETYGEKHLFVPLGMDHYWKRTYLGVVDTEGGLYLRDADLAKIGYLYLNNGIWDGKRIVSQHWVKESLTPYADAGEGYKYGYKWWLYERPESKSYVWTCRGFGGQGLLVFPEERLLVVVTGWEILKDEMPEKTVVDHVLAALRSRGCGSGKS
jgi:CubicO group peptidase (beta-lactamase class C family)